MLIFIITTLITSLLAGIMQRKRAKRGSGTTAPDFIGLTITTFLIWFATLVVNLTLILANNLGLPSAKSRYNVLLAEKNTIQYHLDHGDYYVIAIEGDKEGQKIVSVNYIELANNHNATIQNYIDIGESYWTNWYANKTVISHADELLIDTSVIE